MALLYVNLKFFTWILSHKLNMKGFESGEYGNPPSLFFWSRQAAVYVVALLSMKLIVLAIVGVIPYFSNASEWLLSWLTASLQVILCVTRVPVRLHADHRPL